MPRPSASVPPEAIRIEDEVFEEAFARREPARRRLHGIDGGRQTEVPVAAAQPTPTAPARSVTPPAGAASPVTPSRAAVTPRAAAEPRTAAGQRAVGGVPGRRTVTIRGYGAERNLPWPDSSPRRPQRRAYERSGFRPDRVAMWAVLLGILLVVVAVSSGHG